ncbi:MAG: thiamine phosphate synthase [Betaproteobacteria bacterium]|nr:thiamine phosphate synthase [Betaproteobacteria bacterium]
MATVARPSRLRGLYAVTPDIADTALLCRSVDAALKGGARLLQYRNKGAGAALRHEQAHALAALCRDHGVPLILNDDVALALEVGADGVHLGRDDAGLHGARQRLGPHRLLGASCYDQAELARRAALAGADYVAFGSVFSSPTKPAAVRAPLELFGWARAELPVACAAIGGITLDNAAAVVAAGADLLAVITDLFDAPDIEARARGYAALFGA